MENSVAALLLAAFPLMGNPGPAVDLSLEDFPNLARWRSAIKERPAVQRGVDLGKEFRRGSPPSAEERKILFNQTAP